MACSCWRNCTTGWAGVAAERVDPPDPSPCSVVNWMSAITSLSLLVLGGPVAVSSGILLKEWLLVSMPDALPPSVRSPTPGNPGVPPAPPIVSSFLAVRALPPP